MMHSHNPVPTLAILLVLAGAVGWGSREWYPHGYWQFPLYLIAFILVLSLIFWAIDFITNTVRPRSINRLIVLWKDLSPDPATEEKRNTILRKVTGEPGGADWLAEMPELMKVAEEEGPYQVEAMRILLARAPYHENVRDILVTHRHKLEDADMEPFLMWLVTPNIGPAHQEQDALLEIVPWALDRIPEDQHHRYLRRLIRGGRD